MKRCFLVISMVLVFATALMGCATSGDLKKVQAREELIDAKTDQALQEAQAAKAAADAATSKADAAASRAENAVKMAEERGRVAEEKAARAEAAFQKSMRK